MFKVFDYYCPKCDVMEERLVDASEIDSQHCKRCDSQVFREFPAPKGYVKGSNTPVKQ